MASPSRSTNTQFSSRTPSLTVQGSPSTDEARWTPDDVWGAAAGSIPGLAGTADDPRLAWPVRIWVAQAGAEPAVTELKATIVAASADDGVDDVVPLLVDPEPVACGGELQLFFGAMADGAALIELVGETGGTLFGLWQAPSVSTVRALQRSLSLPGTAGLSETVWAWPGRDFVVRAPDPATGESADQISVAWRTEDEPADPAGDPIPRVVVYADPDVVALPTGTSELELFVHGESLEGATGLEDAVCRSAADAWSPTPLTTWPPARPLRLPGAVPARPAPGRAGPGRQLPAGW